MIVDTSALLAIHFREPEAAQFESAIVRSPFRAISVASVIEASAVLLKRLGPSSIAELDLLIERFPIQVLPVTTQQLCWARYALETYGRGRHPARLNFGDCFSYALAKATSQPLLFKGSDFSQTDLDLVS